MCTMQIQHETYTIVLSAMRDVQLEPIGSCAFYRETTEKVKFHIHL